MSQTFSDLLAHLSPFMTLLIIIVTNQLFTVVRADRKTAQEGARVRAALAAELRALFTICRMNLEALEQKAEHVLSTRMAMGYYKANLGRLSAFLEPALIECLIAVYAEIERIDSTVAIHSNPKCVHHYQLVGPEPKREELKAMYARLLDDSASALALIEGTSPEQLELPHAPHRELHPLPLLTGFEAS